MNTLFFFLNFVVVVIVVVVVIIVFFDTLYCYFFLFFFFFFFLSYFSHSPTHFLQLQAEVDRLKAELMKSGGGGPLLLTAGEDGGSIIIPNRIGGKLGMSDASAVMQMWEQVKMLTSIPPLCFVVYFNLQWRFSQGLILL